MTQVRVKTMLYSDGNWHYRVVLLAPAFLTTMSYWTEGELPALKGVARRSASW